MSFGFGVGDFLAVIELAKKIRSGFASAPEQLRTIFSEIRSLSYILQDAEDVSQELSDRQQTELQDILAGCYDVLRELEKVLDKHSELRSSGGALGSRVKRVWKRLNWDPQDVREYRDRITSNITLLNAFCGQISSEAISATKKGVDKLNQLQADQGWLDMLDWLTPIDYSSQQNDFFSRRQPETGQWLLETPEYKTWVESAGQTLFCPGIPGAGKTILTSLVVHTLLSQYYDDPDISVAYIYGNFRRNDDQKIQDILASLLKQLSKNQRKFTQDLYNHHQPRKSKPSVEEISKALHQAAAQHTRVFIIIDALDEISNHCRERLLFELFKLQKSQQTNTFATSRSILNIAEAFHGNLSVEIRASGDDIKRYIKEHLLQMPSCVKRNRDLQITIAKSISEATDGMFLLAQLYLRMLEDKMTPKAIRNALQYLKKQSQILGDDAKLQVLSDAYDQAMDRISRQKSGLKELAINALSWITCAKRPLTTNELLVALAIDVGDLDLDEDNKPLIEDVASACAGLVAIDEQSDIVRLVHYTTQEYFEHTLQEWFPNAQTDITRVCLTYLSFSIFSSGPVWEDGEYYFRLQAHPLYDYASHYWGEHAQAAPDICPDVLLFLGRSDQMEASAQILFNIQRRGDNDETLRRSLKRTTALHLVAYFGIVDALDAVLDSTNLNAENFFGQTPLFLAAESGHTAIVKLLLSADGVEPDSKDHRDMTPLSRAASRGQEATVRLLLSTDGVDPDSKDWTDRTPLSHAAKNGHEGIFRLLLSTDGVNPDSKDKTGMTPLSHAAHYGDEAIVRLLLSTESVDPNSKDRTGMTPLAHAADNGHEAIVRLLLSTDGIDPNSVDWIGMSPLSHVAKNGHEAIARLLLSTDGVNPDLKDLSGMTPLSHAAHYGGEAIVRLLLSTDGVNADSKDKIGMIPLSHAAKNGNEAIARLLLSTDGVDPDSKDLSGMTPLSLAARYGEEAIVRLLLSVDGVNPDLKDRIGITPLSHAASKGHEAIVRLLLSVDGVNPDLKDRIGITPLSHAASKGHEAIVRLLLSTDGVDPDSKDLSGMKPLSYAAKNGYEAIVRLLISIDGIDPDSKDGAGMTPLSNAAYNGHEAVIRLLLLSTDGVNPNSKDGYGATPLSYAAHSGHEAIVRLLLSTDGIDLDSVDSDGMTPLSHAARNGYEAIVRLLLSTDGVNPDLKDRTGMTPLSHAAENGHEPIVKLLMSAEGTHPTF